MNGSQRITGAFFEQETRDLARALLGKKLVTSSRGVETSGMIVEVEAYLGSGDPACHAARGMTKRNEVMFRSPGHCYVYLIYGMHYCVNLVSNPEGVGSAVLIRALEPLKGLEAMRRRRKQQELKPKALARGPGRLCESFGINAKFSGEHFESSQKIWLEHLQEPSPRSIARSGRIGISKGTDLQLRFYLQDNEWVSE
jgi:DNA-3-methyladenine glycosylase